MRGAKDSTARRAVDDRAAHARGDGARAALGRWRSGGAPSVALAPPARGGGDAKAFFPDRRAL